MQFQSDILHAEVIRPQCVETTAMGAAYLAGLAVGVWENLDDIQSNREVDRIFVPTVDGETRDSMLRGWHKAVERSKNWEDK